jgi:hypothetical protein
LNTPLAAVIGFLLLIGTSASHEIPEAPPNYNPNGPDQDCTDFAQPFALPLGDDDPHELDTDQDRVACEGPTPVERTSVYVVAAAGIAALVGSVLVAVQAVRRAKVRQRTESLDDQIERYSEHLQEAALLAQSMESQIVRRRATIAELEEELERVRTLLELDREKANAIAAVLEQGQNEREKRSLRINVIVSAMSAILTLLAAPLVERILDRLASG